MSSSRPFASGGVMVGVPETRLIDTDVVSFVFRGDTSGGAYLGVLAESILAVSFMTLAELERWAREPNWGNARRSRTESFLSDYTIVMPNRALCRT